VVQAQTVALQEQRGLLQIDTQRLRASVQLIRSVGGGWTTDELASKRSNASAPPTAAARS
jgi:outer membrane protein TolC